MKQSAIVAFCSYYWASASVLAYQPAAGGRPVFSRRRALQRTAAAGAGAIIPVLSQLPPQALAKGLEQEIESVRATSDSYRSILKDRESFVSELAAEDSTTRLPPQVPAITLQKLARVAHGVEGKMDDADDFPFLAVEYAEAAGGARDYFKLAKLGRSGENGGPEVSMEYAKQCASKLEEASVVLETLREAVQ